MEDTLHKIQVWASHGTLRQFHSEVAAKIAPHGYEAALKGTALTCYRVGKAGGFLGIGARKTRRPVLKLTRGSDGVTIDEDSVDEEFITLLAGMLEQH